jgi:hypothetical protein
VSFPDLSAFSRSGVSSVPAVTGPPAVTGTIHFSASSLPTQPLLSAGAPAAPVANTGSAWGATGPLRPTKSNGLVWLLALMGGLAAVVVSLGVWFAIRRPAEVASGTAAPGGAASATAEILPPVASIVVSAAPAGTDSPAVPSAVTASAPDAPVPTASATVAVSAKPRPSSTGVAGGAGTATTGGAAPKPTGKKPASPTPPKFGGIF